MRKMIQRLDLVVNKAMLWIWQDYLFKWSIIQK